MGRSRYTDKERDQIIIAFIRAAREIIQNEGIEKVSIRKIAALTGFNSATIYLYFPNADALITLALMSYLEKYCRSLANDMHLMNRPEQVLTHTWEVFCQYAFTYPQIFRHIFYTPHTVALSETVDTYYRLFPQQLENISGDVRQMLHQGEIADRSMTVLLPVAQKRGFSQEDTRLINELLVCYFRELLEERCRDEDGLLLSEQLTAKLLHALKYLTGS